MNSRDKLEIKVLRAARASIASENNRFICLAIEWVVDNHREYEDVYYAGLRLKRWITRMLDGEVYLDAWISKSRFNEEFIKTTDELTTQVIIRSYRLQWIDWMIKHIKENPSNNRINTDKYPSKI